MSVAIEPLCFWEVAKLKTYHNKPQLSPPLIIHKETNYTSLYIHPKICLHQSLQWYIFRWKYIYIICGFFTVVCTVPFCPSIYAYIIFTLRESFESLERECGSCFFWGRKMSLGFYSAISLVFSVASAVRVFQLCWPTTVWGLITLKG